jgi:carbon-monoxide dehydrogenase catalytic subunit
MVRVGGLGDSIADLPAAGAAPEWMSEKAISHWPVLRGLRGLHRIRRHLPDRRRDQVPQAACSMGWNKQGLGKWGFSADPYEMARMMIAHIDKKRKALGIDKARDRVLMDMSDRRDIDAA